MWCGNFQHGDFETKDAAKSERLSEVFGENVDHDLILTDRQISAEAVALVLKLPGERLELMVHEYMDLQKLTTK